MAPEAQRFRGAVVRHESARGAGVGTCEVTAAAIRLSSPIRGAFVLERPAVRAVVIDRQRGPFSWRTDVRFSAGSTPYPMRFVPWRPNRFRATLKDHGWPVADQ